MSRPGRALFTDLSPTSRAETAWAWWAQRLGQVDAPGRAHRAAPAGVRPGTQGVMSGSPPRPTPSSRRPGSPAVGDGWEAEAVLDHLGMCVLATPTSALSGGQAKRVALARPSSPTATSWCSTNRPTISTSTHRWLEDRLAGYRGGLVLVTHDRHLLDRVHGTAAVGRRVPSSTAAAPTCTPGATRATWTVGPSGRPAAPRRGEARNLARRELEWLRRGAPARTSKPKARLAAATAAVESRPQAPARQGELDLLFARHPPTGRHGGRALGGRPPWGGQPFLFEGLDLPLDPRERLGRGRRTAREIHPVGDPGRPARGRPRAGRTGRPPALATTTRSVPCSTAAQGPRGGHRGRPPPRLEDAALWSPSGSTPTPCGRPSTRCRAGAPAAAAAARRSPPAQRAAPRRAHQRPRPRHAARPGGLPRRLARRAARRQPRPGLPRAHGRRRAGARRPRLRRSRPGGHAAWLEQFRATHRHTAVGGKRLGRSAVAPRPHSGGTADDPVAGPPPPPGRPPPRSPSTLRQLLRETARDLARLERGRDQLDEALAGAGGGTSRPRGAGAARLGTGRCLRRAAADRGALAGAVPEAEDRTAGHERSRSAPAEQDPCPTTWGGGVAQRSRRSPSSYALVGATLPLAPHNCTRRRPWQGSGRRPGSAVLYRRGTSPRTAPTTLVTAGAELLEREHRRSGWRWSARPPPTSLAHAAAPDGARRRGSQPPHRPRPGRGHGARRPRRGVVGGYSPSGLPPPARSSTPRRRRPPSPWPPANGTWR